MNVISMLLLSASFAAAPEVQVRTLAGQSVAGTLKELSAQRVVLATGEGEQTLATKDLLGVSLAGSSTAAAARPRAWISFVDGTRLAGLEYTAAKGQAAFQLTDGVVLKMATSAIESVRLKEQNERIAQQWADIAGMKRAADVIVVRREEAIDFLEGVLGDVTAETVQFKLEGDQVNVKRPRVEGFLYFHAKETAELPSAVCEVHTRDGSRIPATSVALRGSNLAIVTRGGSELVLPLETIRELDFSAGKLRYLSDLDWESVERQSYLSASDARGDRLYEPRKDSSFLGPLRLGNKTYAKGLAIKSRTKLVYRLPGKFSRLVGTAGINALLAPGGNVLLTIRGDDKQQPLWEAAISGAEPPQEFSVDLTGARRLTIEVDFGAGGDTGDHLNLCDARLIQ